MGRAKLLEQFVFAWYHGFSCAYLLFQCVLKSAHIASKMSAPYASKKTIKMGLKDYRRFPLEQISVTKFQGRTNTRHHHLSIPGRLSVYEVVGDGWQPNVINAHVPFDNTTKPFLQALAEVYCQMAMFAPTIIIGDMNAAHTPAERGGQANPRTMQSATPSKCWGSWT